MIVCKFGGTSVGDADAIRRTASIVQSRLDRQPIVVVSALGGATNQLLALAEQAARGQLIGALRAVQNLRDRHMKEAAALLGTGDGATEVTEELSTMLDELASLAEALSVLGHITPRSLDAVAALGEQLSSHIVAAAFRRSHDSTAGVNAVTWLVPSFGEVTLIHASPRLMFTSSVGSSVPRLMHNGPSAV